MNHQADARALCQECMNYFIQLIQSVDERQCGVHEKVSASQIENEHSRFKIWCGNLGAMQTGGSSLEARLRGSTVVRETVLMFLVQLRQTLTQSLEIATGSRLPIETQMTRKQQSATEYAMRHQPHHQEELNNDSLDGYISGDLDSSDDEYSELQEMYLEIVDTISHLYRTSFNVRNSHQRTVSSKAFLMKLPDPETKVDVFSVYEVLDHQHVQESLTHLRIGSQLTEGKPDYKVIEGPEEFLIKRLARAITNRRRCFAYWRRHSLKLSTAPREVPLRPVTLRFANPRNYHSEDEEQISRDQNIQKAVRTVNPGPSSIVSGTLMSETEVSHYRTDLDTTFDTHSNISYATTAKDEEGNGVDLPAAPEDAFIRQEFLCPYCYVLCPSRQGHSKAWRAHILRDLQPYVCTYPECPEEDCLYTSRNAWLEHERLLHRRIWRCFEPDHKSRVYVSQEGLRVHFQENHVELSEEQIHSILDLTVTTTVDTRDVCPFCAASGPFENGLDSHMAFHQERLATFAIPRGNHEQNDDDSNKFQGVRSTADLLSASMESHNLVANNDDGSKSMASEGDTNYGYEDLLPSLEMEAEILSSLRTEPFDGGRNFLPLSILERMDEESIRKSLPPNIRKPRAELLSEKIFKHAKRLYAILIIIREPDSIWELVRQEIGDKDLPFRPGNDDKVIVTSDRRNTLTIFAKPERSHKVDIFLRHQWQVLSPIIGINARYVALETLCPFPFEDVTRVGNGTPQTYKVRLSSVHAKHVLAVDNATVVAVKLHKRPSRAAEIVSTIGYLSAHQHVVPVHSVYERDTDLYIVLPWADGGNLKQLWTEPPGRLSVPDIYAWSLQQIDGVVAAVEFLHYINFPHTMLEPENILLFSHGHLTMKIRSLVGELDRFAFRGWGEKQSHHVQATGEVISSYIPPELDCGKHLISYRESDVWSLGCILLEYMVWLLHDNLPVFTNSRARANTGYAAFYAAKQNPPDSREVETSTEITSIYEVHPTAMENIESLKNDARVMGHTALGDFIDLIPSCCLNIDLKLRSTAYGLLQKTSSIVKEVERNPSYLMNEVQTTPQRSRFPYR